MARRFDRNQKRALAAAVAQARAEVAAAHNLVAERGRAAELSESRLRREVADARRARDTIRVSVDAMLDDREGDMRVTASFDMRSRETLHAAEIINRSDIDRRSQGERAAFVEYVGAIIAEHALQQVLRHWRSR